MSKAMNNKHRVIVGIAAMVLIVGGATAWLSSSGKKSALHYYEQFKERYFLEDVLAEGPISYSIFSGDLTVAKPQIRIAAVQTNGVQLFMRSLAGLFEAARDVDSEEGLAAWAKYQFGAASGRTVAGVYLNADALKLSHSGDSQDGEIHVQLLGMEMGNPFIAHKGSEVVLVADVSDEIQPRAELDAQGQATRSSYAWGSNQAVRNPATGAFLVSSTASFGTTVDLDLSIKRSSDGEGSMAFVVTHHTDGDTVGRIVRKANFASLPPLDEVQGLLKNALSGFIVGAYSSYSGQAVFAEAVSTFARKTKVAHYSLEYSGFEALKASYAQFQHTAPKAGYAAFCEAVGLSQWSSDFGAKGNRHNDSECAIAQKLIEEEAFEEQFTFQEGKSLFAALFVSKAYDLETD